VFAQAHLQKSLLKTSTTKGKYPKFQSETPKKCKAKCFEAGWTSPANSKVRPNEEAQEKVTNLWSG